jgi:hypothetical protein
LPLQNLEFRKLSFQNLKLKNYHLKLIKFSKLSQLYSSCAYLINPYYENTINLGNYSNTLAPLSLSLYRHGNFLSAVKTPKALFCKIGRGGEGMEMEVKFDLLFTP